MRADKNIASFRPAGRVTLLATLLLVLMMGTVSASDVQIYGDYGLGSVAIIGTYAKVKQNRVEVGI